MITLVQFPPSLGLPNSSPFCMRVETFLRLAGLEYEIEAMPDPRKAPKGKLPVIRDGGEVIADSHMAIAHLTQKYDVKLDDHLSDAQRVTSHLVTRTLCEHYYWCLVYGRFIDDEGWARVQVEFRKMAPPVIGGLVMGLVRSGTSKQCRQAGVGRHSQGEVRALAREDLQAVSGVLGAGPYMFGEEVSTLDATVFSFLANTLWGPPAWLADEARGLDDLVAYTRRMRERCFSDMVAGRE